jgi:hypothetical protein
MVGADGAKGSDRSGIRRPVRTCKGTKTPRPGGPRRVIPTKAQGCSDADGTRGWATSDVAARVERVRRGALRVPRGWELIAISTRRQGARQATQWHRILTNLVVVVEGKQKEKGWRGKRKATEDRARLWIWAEKTDIAHSSASRAPFLSLSPVLCSAR